jgi:hypothetical protein
MAGVIGVIACAVLGSVAWSTMTSTAATLRGTAVAAREEIGRCKDGVDEAIRSVQAMRIAQLVQDANDKYNAASRTKPFAMDIDTSALADLDRDELARRLSSAGFVVCHSDPSGEANTLSIRRGARTPVVATAGVVAPEMGRVLDPEIPDAYRNFASAAIAHLAKPGLPPSAVMRMTMRQSDSPEVLRDLSRALAPRGLVCRVGQMLRDGELRWTLTIARKDTPAPTPAPSRKRAASRSRSRATATTHKRARQ